MSALTRRTFVPAAAIAISILVIGCLPASDFGRAGTLPSKASTPSPIPDAPQSTDLVASAAAGDPLPSISPRTHPSDAPASVLQGPSLAISDIGYQGLGLADLSSSSWRLLETDLGTPERLVRWGDAGCSMLLYFRGGTQASVGLDGVIREIVFDPQDLDIPGEHPVLNSEVSPDGRWAALTTFDQGGSAHSGYVLTTWITQTKRQAPTPSEPQMHPGRFLAWAPTSQLLAYQGSTTDRGASLVVTPPDRTNPQVLLEMKLSDSQLEARFSPDASKLAVRADGRVFLLDVGGQSLELPLKPEDHALSHWWAGESSLAVYAEERGEDYTPGVRGPRSVIWFSAESGVMVDRLDESDSPRREISLPGPMANPHSIGFFSDNGSFSEFNRATREFLRFPDFSWPFLVEAWWATPAQFPGEANCPRP